MKIAQAETFAARLDSVRRIMSNIHIVALKVERLYRGPGEVAEVHPLADTWD